MVKGDQVQLCLTLLGPPRSSPSNKDGFKTMKWKWKRNKPKRVRHLTHHYDNLNGYDFQYQALNHSSVWYCSKSCSGFVPNLKTIWNCGSITSLMFFEIIKLGLYLFWKLFEITIHQFDDKWNHYAGFISNLREALKTKLGKI